MTKPQMLNLADALRNRADDTLQLAKIQLSDDSARMLRQNANLLTSFAAAFEELAAKEEEPQP